MQISLTREEQELFDLLLASVNFHKKSTTIRVAGGWVRDKALRKESPDIDVALDDQTGVEFANGVNAFLAHLGKETRTVAVIMANPDQSKHLETATMRVLGFELDCVHLRAEAYTDSRIPTIMAGTAEEDAARRDFTINSLFYNINSRQVEDLTGKGLADLQSGIIRTPLSPFVTFREDPLRVLRAVRFASRYGFKLHEELVAAARSAEIKRGLLTKVSRERILKECDGMIRHASADKTCCPALAVMLLRRLGIIDAVLPAHDMYAQQEQSAAAAAAAAASAPQGKKSKRNPPVPATAPSVTPHPQIGDFLLTVVSPEQWMTQAVETVCWLNVLLRARGVLGLWYNNNASNSGSNSWSSSCSANSSGDGTAGGRFGLRLGVGAEAGGRWRSAVIPGMLLRRPEFEATEAKVSYWAALLSPLTAAGVVVPDASKQPGSGRTVSLPYALLRDGLKMDLATMRNVQSMLDAVIDFIGLVEKVREYKEQYSRRDSGRDQDRARTLLVDEAGRILRGCRSLWRDALLLACAHSLGELRLPRPCRPLSDSSDAATALAASGSSPPLLQQHLDDCGGFLDVTISDEADLRCIDKYVSMEQFLETELHMDGVWDLRPLLNGSELLAAFSLPKTRIMTQVMETQMIWQIRYRSSSSRDTISPAPNDVSEVAEAAAEASAHMAQVTALSEYIQRVLPQLQAGQTAAEVARANA